MAFLVSLALLLPLGENAGRWHHYDIKDLHSMRGLPQIPRQPANTIQPNDGMRVEPQQSIGALMDQNRFKQSAGPADSQLIVRKQEAEDKDSLPKELLGDFGHISAKENDWDQNRFRQSADPVDEKPSTPYQKSLAGIMSGQLDKENKDFAKKAAENNKSDGAKAKAKAAQNALQVQASGNAANVAAANAQARAKEEETNPTNDPLRDAGAQQIAKKRDRRGGGRRGGRRGRGGNCQDDNDT